MDKKILLLGENTHTDLLLAMAKEIGLHTIVTDNRSVTENPLKLQADEYWDISVTDIDGLEEKCRKENVSAVTCGASEVCVSSVRLLCKRLDLPFWIDDAAWHYTNDKKEFKLLCQKCGLPVAPEFKLDKNFLREDLDRIEYPVVVKPVDSSASLGMHVCSNEAELIAGYEDACSYSASGKIIVEKYISGIEVNLIYLFKNGVPHFFTSFDSYGKILDGHPMIFGANPTIVSTPFQTVWEKQLNKLFQELNCRNGAGFIQILVSKNEAAVMEMNYRLPGAHFTNEWILHKTMLESALGEEINIEKEAVQGLQTFIYFTWLRPGKIKSIEGIDDITRNVSIISMGDMKQIGAEVRENTGMRQIFTGMVISSTPEEISSKVDYINKTLKIYDEAGNDMLYRYDYVRL
jgi:biotin carboxylase